MYKKTIKYLDFNGVEREEDFYFHLTKAEMIKFEASEKGGISAVLKRMTQEEDYHEILNLFEQFVKASFGRKSADGKSFEKKPEYTDAFISSEAYSELFMEFMSDSDKASEFINGTCSSIIPNPNEKSMAKLLKERGLNVMSDDA